jgi:hypothetical protein
VAAAPVVLRPGLQLPDASSAAAMERHLAVLMARGLQPLLPPPQYSRLMGQLEKTFRPYRLAGSGAASAAAGGCAGAAAVAAGGAGVAVACQLEQLQVM